MDEYSIGIWLWDGVEELDFAGEVALALGQRTIDHRPYRRRVDGAGHVLARSAGAARRRLG